MSDLHDDDEMDDGVEPKPFWRRRKVQLIAAGAVLLIAWLWQGANQPPPKREQEKLNETFIGAVVPYQAPAAPPPVRVAAQPLAPPAPPVAPPAPPPAPPVEMRPAATNPLTAILPQTAVNRTPADPKPAEHRRAMLSYQVHIKEPTPGSAPATPQETGIAFKTASLPGAKASPAMDETLMLTPGLLPLVLDTAIDSNNPGSILAHLPGPVYSPKGVLLMEAETQVIGKYETMSNNGSKRLRVTSAYAHTPNGVWVPLADEAFSDGLGRSGLDGAVNMHVLERFGGAVLLNLVDTALGIVQAEVSKGGNTYLSLNGGGGVGSLAQSILQQTINMPPTFSKNQGEMVALFIDKPIDFSSSYRIRTAQ